MKKLFALVAFSGMMLFAPASFAQTGDTNAVTQEPQTTTTDNETEVEVADEVAEASIDAGEAEAPGGLHNVLKEKFIEGDPLWMTPVLICLIIGLALCIERIITLNLSTANTRKLLNRLDDALARGNVEEAKEVCRSTRGPVASVLFQGLDRLDEGVDIVEKSIISYGSVQMGLLERGLVWISLFIALAPMLGFLGTVVGMIEAFDNIEAAGDISPTVVAGGIKVALLTTVFGLIAAIILQIFYNYIVSKVDSLVNNMEDASISLIDLLVRYNVVKKTNL